MARQSAVPAAHPRNCNHHIQLYSAEESLYHAICSFVLPSFFSQQHAAVIVATQAHLDAMDSYLRSQNLTPELMKKREQLIIAPAEPILEHITPGGVVSTERFVAYFTPLFERLQRKYPRLLIYGELVNILCEREEHDKAHELELVWEDFLVGKEASLLCGYNLNAFVKDGLDDAFSRICSAHSHVAPAVDGSFVGNVQDTQTVIAMLQHRTLRLEAEMSRRYAVEDTLRAALAHMGNRPAHAIAIRDPDNAVARIRLAPVGIIAATSTPTGTEYFCNSRFLELAGVRHARDWVNAVYYRDRDRVTHTLRLADRRSRKCEYRFVLPSGSLRYMAGESEAREDGYVHSAVDITTTRPPSPPLPESNVLRKHPRPSPPPLDAAKEDITSLLWTLLFPSPHPPATHAMLEAWKSRLPSPADDTALAIYHGCHLLLSSPSFSQTHARAALHHISRLEPPCRVAAGIFFLAAPVLLRDAHPPMHVPGLWETLERCRRFRPDAAVLLEAGRCEELLELRPRLQEWIVPSRGKRLEVDGAGVSRELERLFNTD